MYLSVTFTPFMVCPWPTHTERSPTRKVSLSCISFIAGLCIRFHRFWLSLWVPRFRLDSEIKPFAVVHSVQLHGHSICCYSFSAHTSLLVHSENSGEFEHPWSREPCITLRAWAPCYGKGYLGDRFLHLSSKVEIFRPNQPVQCLKSLC